METAKKPWLGVTVDLHRLRLLEQIEAAAAEDMRWSDCGHDPPDECCTGCRLRTLLERYERDYRGDGYE